MKYFDDLRFVQAEEVVDSSAVVDRFCVGSYSLNFISAGRIFFSRDHQPRVVLKKPVILWHQPQHHYHYGSVDQKVWHHYMIQIMGPRAKRIVEIGLNSLAKRGYFFIPQAAIFSQKFAELILLIRKQDIRCHSQAVARLEELISMLSERVSRMGMSSRHIEAIEIIRAGILRNPYKAWNFKAEAAKLHLSLTHFYRLFRNQIGRAPQEFLLLCRMQKAARELENSQRQVKEIACEAGYEDPAQFSKLFKKKKMDFLPCNFAIPYWVIDLKLR